MKCLNEKETREQLENYIKIYESILPSCRKPNFPDYISENIVKFVINKIEKQSCVNADKGDLIKNSQTEMATSSFENSQRVEVKCFTSKGPSSFGPTELWDELYFLDATNFLNGKYKVYKLKLSNTSSEIKNLKINKKQTYEDQCKEKRRPRIAFSQLKQQLNSHIELVFDGYIDDILENVDVDIINFINMYNKIKHKLNNNQLDKIINEINI